TIYEKLLGPVANAQGTRFAAYSTEEQAVVFWDPANDGRVGSTIPIERREWESAGRALSAGGPLFVFTLSRKSLGDRQGSVADVDTGEIRCKFPPPGVYFQDQPILSPDGRYVFLAGDRSVFSPIDTTTGKMVHEVPDHLLEVTCLSFTPDGHTLLVGSRDKR